MSSTLNRLSSLQIESVVKKIFRLEWLQSSHLICRMFSRTVPFVRATKRFFLRQSLTRTSWSA